jgi:hypothetical protein
MSEPIPEPVNPSISITTLSLGNGTVAAPSLAFTSDTDTGLYREAANTLAISSGGVKSFNSSATQLGLYKPLNFSAVAAATGDSTNMYAYRKTATNKIFTNSGTEIELTNQNSQYKLACRVVSTANVTLSGGAPRNVDSASLNVGSRILVNGQTALAENGIYVVTVKGSGADGTWVRSSDLSTADAIYLNTMCFVTEGATYANTFWKITTAPAVLDTDPLVWTQITLSVSVTYPLAAPSGSVGAPTYSFTGSTTTGIYSSGADEVSISNAGVRSALFAANSNVTFTGGVYFSGAGGQSAVTFYQHASASLTVTGAYSSSWFTRIARIGRMITLTFPDDYSSRTSLAASLTTDALGADFRPIAPIRGTLVGYNNGALTTLCYTINTDGTISVGNSATDSSAAFTAATAIAGPYGWSVSFTTGG